MAWPIEDQLLLLCCSRNIPARNLSEPCTTASPDPDWHLFLGKARQNGISSLVHKRLPSVLAHLALTAPPQSVTRELRIDYLRVAARNAAIFNDLQGFLAILAAAGIEVIVLKGAFLAAKVYPDPAMRSMSDVDVLIHKKDLAALHRILLANGYWTPGTRTVDSCLLPEGYLTAIFYWAPSASNTGFHVHWHLVNSSVPNHELINNIVMADIWRAAEKTSFGAVKALALARHHLLMHLAEHSLRVSHSLAGLRFLCDIDEAVAALGPDLNWDQLVFESNRFRLRQFTYLPLALAARKLATPVPLQVLARLRPEPFRLGEKIYAWLLNNDRCFPGAGYLIHLSYLQGVWTKCIFIMRTLFPPRQVLIQRHGLSHDDAIFYFYFHRTTEAIITVFRLCAKILPPKKT